MSDQLPPIECPKTGGALPYTGDEVPSWFRPGAKVRVKSTPETRIKHGSGVRCSGALSSADCAAWAGEVGEVDLDVRPHPTAAEVAAGGCWYGGAPYVAGVGGWYQLVLVFSRGRRAHLRGSDWDLVASVKDLRR